MSEEARPSGPRSVALRLVQVVLVLSCAGCAAEEARLAARGKADVLGFSANEMRMCAGFPNQTQQADGADIWSYKRQASQNGGLTVTSPLSAVPGLSQSATIGASTAYCSMQVRFVDGKVVEVAYTGDDGLNRLTANANCAPLISGCLGYKKGR